MGEFLEIAKVMVQPTMKLLDMCGSAIGTVYEPRHIRKLADAEAYKIKQLGSAITETDNLPIAYENGNISMSTVNFEDFAKRAEHRAKYQLVCEQNNIENVVGKAYQELLDAPEVVDDPVDEDWTARFFNIVKEINSEEMQRIWGKILAGEIKQPGSFSLRTLETIRNISRDEALAFNKIVPYLISAGTTVFLISDREIYEKYGIKYSDILLLDECGLVNSSSTLSLTATATGANALLLYNESTALFVHGSEEKPLKFSYGVHTLTGSGKQLYRILNHVPNYEYFEEIAKSISQNNNEAVYLHKVNYIIDGKINYEDDPYKVLENI